MIIADTGFFLALAWGGYWLLRILSGEHLVTLPRIPTGLTQSVMPIASLAFVAAELLTLPQAWDKLHRSPPAATAVSESSHLE